MRQTLSNSVKLLAAALVWLSLCAVPNLALANATLDKAIAGEIRGLAPKGAHRNYAWKKQVFGGIVRIRGASPKGQIDARFRIPKKNAAGSPGLTPVKIEFKNADGSLIIIHFEKGIESRYEEIKADGTREVRVIQEDGSFKTQIAYSDGTVYRESCDSGDNCSVETGNAEDFDDDPDFDEDYDSGGGGNGKGQGDENGNGGGNGNGNGGGNGNGNG